MIKIGDFSKLCRVTVKALRYYDELGILKPDYVGDENGYRFYNIEKLYRAVEITNYKEMGLSLEEIAHIILNNLIPSEILKVVSRKKTEVQENLNSEEKKLARLTNFIREIQESKLMSDVTLKSLPEVFVASCRTKIADYNALFKVVPEMGEKMAKHKVVCRDPFYCFNIYHDGEFKESDIDVEICEAVIKLYKSADGIQYKKIEEVEYAACLYHVGPYSKIGNSYAKLLNWMETNGFQAVDNPRESFIDGCWNKECEDEWLTEIQYPVKKAEQLGEGK